MGVRLKTYLLVNKILCFLTVGTAADIMEFFESYKDVNIIKIDLLVFLTLGIWSWSLMQFTIVLSATRARRPRGGGINRNDGYIDQKLYLISIVILYDNLKCSLFRTTDCCDGCCCGIDIWAIVLNVILQDAPFLTLRMLIIFQYKILNYMSVFFTCEYWTIHLK